MQANSKSQTPLADNLSELAILAHDIKDPLSYALVSLNSLKTIADELENTPEDFFEKYNFIHSVVKNNLYRALRISNNILDAQSIIRNDTKLFISPCNISELLKSNLQAIKEVLRLKNATDKLILNVSEPFIACVDEFALERVILNLLTNAINHLPHTNASIIITLSLKGDNFEIEVKDNGYGIKEEAIPHIFNKFYKQTDVNFHSSNGAGLGLFICKSLITLHGGTIDVKSVPEKETVFTVSLPYQLNEVRVVTLNSETQTPFTEKYDTLLKHELSSIE